MLVHHTAAGAGGSSPLHLRSGAAASAAGLDRDTMLLSSADSAYIATSLLTGPRAVQRSRLVRVAS